MRSTGFVALSLLLHCLCVMALALTPSNTLAPASGGDKIEVNVGEPADQAGAPEAETKPTTAPQPEQAKVEETPAPTPAPAPVPTVKPHKVSKAKPVAKKATVKAAAVAEPPKSEDENAPSVSPVAAADAATEEDVETQAIQADDAGAAAAAKAAEDAAKAEPKEELKPVKEAAPAGVEAAKDDGKAADARELAKPAAAAGDLGKGGATPAAAVSYLDLKQMAGNKLPEYPLQARLERRQGSLELIYRVNKDGTVTDVQVVKSSGSKDLDESAVKAIATYRFVPGQEGWARHPVVFSLKGAVATLPSRPLSKGKQAQAD